MFGFVRWNECGSGRRIRYYELFVVFAFHFFKTCRQQEYFSKYYEPKFDLSIELFERILFKTCKKKIEINT